MLDSLADLLHLHFLEDFADEALLEDLEAEEGTRSTEIVI